jgi:hypothetical protein
MQNGEERWTDGATPTDFGFTGRLRFSAAQIAAFWLSFL